VVSPRWPQHPLGMRAVVRVVKMKPPEGQAGPAATRSSDFWRQHRPATGRLEPGGRGSRPDRTPVVEHQPGPSGQARAPPGNLFGGALADLRRAEVVDLNFTKGAVIPLLDLAHEKPTSSG